MALMYVKFSRILAAFGFLLLVSSCGQPDKVATVQEAGQEKDELLAQIDGINKEIMADSLNPDLFEKRARIYVENEAWNEAFKDITTALELDSTYSGYYVTLSDVYLGMGKLQKTVEALENAVALDPENTNAYLKLAEMSIVIRDYKMALSYIDKAIQVDDLIAKAYMLRGVILLENGDTVRGIRNFQKAVDVDQDYLEAHIQLGTLFALKKNDLAVDYFNNALNIDPGNIDVNYYLGMYYQESGKYDRAIQIYNHILDMQPDFYIANYNIGYINLVYLSDFETAVDYFSRTVEQNPEYVEAYYNRGFAYEMMKDVQNSQKDYRKVLDLHPNYEKAIDGLNRIEEYLERN